MVSDEDDDDDHDDGRSGSRKQENENEQPSPLQPLPQSIDVPSTINRKVDIIANTTNHRQSVDILSTRNRTKFG